MVLSALFGVFDIDAEGVVIGAGVAVPAEPIPVFHALQDIDPGWFRLLALVPSESALALRSAELHTPLTVAIR